jgi:hypothetical protein
VNSLYLNRRESLTVPDEGAWAKGGPRPVLGWELGWLQAQRWQINAKCHGRLCSPEACSLLLLETHIEGICPHSHRCPVLFGFRWLAFLLRVLWPFSLRLLTSLRALSWSLSIHSFIHSFICSFTIVLFAG